MSEGIGDSSDTHQRAWRMGHARWWVRSLPNNAVWQAALARTLSLASYALTAAGRAHDAEADAQRAWSGALAAVDSVTRATGVAELRVLKATALASLGRVEDARPIVRTLEQQGYRRPRWLARTRAAGLLPQQ